MYEKKFVYNNLDKIFIFILIFIFFIFHFTKLSYGLPYAVNLDEIEFQQSVLSSLSFLTGYFEFHYNPLYGSLINLLLILKSIFINEFLINSLNTDQIRSKIYFNPELFMFYGRVASLTIVSISIFFLYLIFKKLKVNFLIYSTLLITFSTSMVVFNISTIMSKNSCNLLFFLLQLYFFIKYFLKIEKFNFKSYLVFGFLSSLAWGVNYWPAFISIYSVILLHYKKFKFLNIRYLLVFSIIFVFFGPIINSLFVSMGAFEHMGHFDGQENPKKIGFLLLINHFIDNVLISLKIIYLTEKNIFLLIFLTPIFLLNKKVNFKKEFLAIFFLIIAPIFIFGITGNYLPQLRYFAGIIAVIIILTGLIFSELYKTKTKYFTVILVIFNFFFIFINYNQSIKITNALSNNHSFFNFNKNIKNNGIETSKILYLVDLNFQESLKQNLYYIKLYENNLIKKNDRSKKFLTNIKNKIQIIKNTENIVINDYELKNDITYFNYTFFQIDNLELFFDFVKKDFEYVVIEESAPYYLSDRGLQKKIKNFVKENYLLDYIQFDQDKIFLRSQQSVIHYYANTLSRYDNAKNINQKGLKVIYGTNYSLYKIKNDTL